MSKIVNKLHTALYFPGTCMYGAYYLQSARRFFTCLKSKTLTSRVKTVTNASVFLFLSVRQDKMIKKYN